MKRIVVSVLLFIASASICHAQKKAVTETGAQVILYDNGTWKYTSDSDAVTDAPKGNNDSATTVNNSEQFTKGSSSTFLLKSTKVKGIGFWLDPKKWQFKKAENNPEAEFELEEKDQELFGMIISEEIEIPLESLKSLALINAKKVAPDAHIIKAEYRLVNGLKIMLLEINGTVSGIQFTYYGYYFSDANGTIQFVTYSSQDLMQKYLSDAESLLNGIVELKTGSSSK
jgi:hypothetical protein